MLLEFCRVLLLLKKLEIEAFSPKVNEYLGLVRGDEVHTTYFSFYGLA
jgi:hypothetical protein